MFHLLQNIQNPQNVLLENIRKYGRLGFRRNTRKWKIFFFVGKITLSTILTIYQIYYREPDYFYSIS